MENISLNFGAIKDTVYKISAREIVLESESHKKQNNSLSKFIKKIKEEPLLRVQYMIFENLTRGHFENERLAERYISENMSLTKSLHWHNLLECNKKVRKEILDDIFVQGDEKLEKVYEAIHNLIESKTNLGYTDINKSHSSYEVVLEHLQRKLDELTREDEEKEDMPNFFSWKYINEHAVSNFNKRYNHLNESDKKLLKILISSDDIKINFAEDLKTECIERLDYLLENEDEFSDLLESFSNKLKSIENINLKNVEEVIINCHELKENLNQIS
jgi:hypothetical protein